MSKKTIDQVRDYFTSHSCTLLEDEYKDGRTPMSYRCVCGNESKIRFDNFRSGQRCQRCKAKKSSAINTKYSLQQAKEIFEKENCTLLAEKYETTKVLMNFICSCGGYGKVGLGHFLLGRRCLNCKITRRSATRRQPIEKIRELFALDGYTLLSEEYVNTSTPVQFRCPKGHEHQITVDNWKRGKQRCRLCYQESNVGENHPNWVHDRVEKQKFDSIRSRCCSMLHATLNATNQVKNGKTFTLLGYNAQELYDHLSSFPNWKSLQKYKWHVDHIFPIDAFVKNGIFDIHIINALDNLQPMLGKDNSSKSNRYNRKKFAKYLLDKHGIRLK